MVATPVLPDEKVIDVPPDGASPVSVTVAVAEDPPETEMGESTKVPIFATQTVRVWVTGVVDPTHALIVEELVAFWPVVVMVKVAVVAPAATVTVAGTVAHAAEELRLTEVPPVGAWPVRVTVPVDVWPPFTPVGESDKLDTVGELTVNVAVALDIYMDAVITGYWVVDTARVVIVKLAEVLPAATVTEVGTVAALVIEADRDIGHPPAGAGPVRVTVPVEVFPGPPTTLVGDTVTLAIVGGMMMTPPFAVS
jgi:hypothetical protein